MNKINKYLKKKELLFVVDGNGDYIENISKIITTEQAERIRKNKEKEILFKKSVKPFTFTEMLNIKQVMPMLNSKELGCFLLMQVYIDYDNILNLSNVAKKPMTESDLGQILQIKSKRTLDALLSKLENLSLIFRDSVTKYGKKHEAIYINDTYCFRKDVHSKYNNKKTDQAVKLFMDSLQEVFVEGNIKPADIGFMYKIIPYIHYDNNLLPLDPFKRDITKVTGLPINELAVMLDISREEISKKLGSMKWNGMGGMSLQRLK
ncbi:hypothetical protein [Bacillus sp. RC51]|uniref:hypothetical protein n=1 Tax=Bacillus sp. RC51 TaxID=3156288 RepID=UPI0038388C4C